MINASLAWAILAFAAGQGAEPTSSVVQDIENATRLQRSLPCRPSDLGATYELIRRYGQRREPELRLIVARGRMAAAFAYSFVSEREQARRWYGSVVRLYANENGEEFRGIVARARLNLIEGIADDSTRLRRLTELADDLAAQNGPGTSRTYHDALMQIAEVLERRGESARARELRQQARDIWTTSVAPHLPPMTGDEPICV